MWVPLSRGEFTLIDADNQHLFERYKWTCHLRGRNRNRKAYAIRQATLAPGVKKMVQLHRLITKCPKGLVVDHINGDTLDNRRCNLRVCTHQQNTWNQKQARHGRKWKGVVHRKRPGCWEHWQACITVNRKFISLGSYASAREAAEAYNRAAIQHYGDHACLNDLSAYQSSLLLQGAQALALAAAASRPCGRTNAPGAIT